MRILLITHFFPPTHIAGTENYSLSLAHAFQTKGHRVEVLCAEDWHTGRAYWNGITEEIHDDIEVHRIHLNWTKAEKPNEILYDSPLVESWLDAFLKDRRFDVVHVISTITLGIGILRSVKRAGIPLILTLMDFWFLCPSIQLLRSDGSLCDGRTTEWQCHSCLLANSDVYQKFRKLPIPETLQSLIFRALSHVNGIANRRGLRGVLLNIDRRKHMLAEGLSLPDRIITHSQIVQKMVGLNHPIHVDVLRNGHATNGSRARTAGMSAEKSPNGLRFAYMGQILPFKGVHVLIRAFLEAGIETRSRLDIWGDLRSAPDYARGIQSLCAGSRSIHYRGGFERKDLASVLAEIDVLVVPSLWYENAPLVIQEALAAGNPVIATDLGGMAEVVQDGINGLLFRRGNKDDLGRQLKRLIDEPDLLDRLRAGITAVKTMDQEVEELESLYGEVIRRLPPA
jgi:glycosyltransferase involved in cell wall biosynthesis